MMDELAQEISQELLARGEQLALAESCTGGLIAKRVTDIPGCSAWFERGLVVYANSAKQSLLGVSEDVLHRYGAVSEECVTAMVNGLLNSCPAHWGVAVTGIAGPGGGTPDKPVGLVWLAWLRRGFQVRTQGIRFNGDRAQVREQTAQLALEVLLQDLRGGG